MLCYPLQQNMQESLGPFLANASELIWIGRKYNPTCLLHKTAYYDSESWSWRAHLL